MDGLWGITAQDWFTASMFVFATLFSGFVLRLGQYTITYAGRLLREAFGESRRE